MLMYPCQSGLRRMLPELVPHCSVSQYFIKEMCLGISCYKPDQADIASIEPPCSLDTVTVCGQIFSRATSLQQDMDGQEETIKTKLRIRTRLAGYLIVYSTLRYRLLYAS